MRLRALARPPLGSLPLAVAAAQCILERLARQESGESLAGLTTSWPNQMLPSRIYLRDRNAPLANAWRESFATADEVSVDEGDFFEQPADAMVSPANSFGCAHDASPRKRSLYDQRLPGFPGNVARRSPPQRIERGQDPDSPRTRSSDWTWCNGPPHVRHTDANRVRSGQPPSLVAKGWPGPSNPPNA